MSTRRLLVSLTKAEAAVLLALAENGEDRAALSGPQKAAAKRALTALRVAVAIRAIGERRDS